MRLAVGTLVFSLIVWSSQATAYSIHYPRFTLDAEKRTTTIVNSRDTNINITTAESSPDAASPEDICYILGRDCKVVDGKATLPSLKDRQPQSFLQVPGLANGTGIVLNDNEQPGHPDGNKSHIYTVRYDDTVVPIGVCNPRLFGQYVMDYGCPKGMKGPCRAKAEWPCNYPDDSFVGKHGWDPHDDGQADVRNCTMGISGTFGSGLGQQLPGQDSFLGLIDFLKDFTLKAMEPPMQVDGGNTSVSPMPNGNGKDGSTGRNVTVYQVPAAMTVAAVEVIPGQVNINAEGFNSITVTVDCPQPKKSKSICGIMMALVGLAAASLAIGQPEITAGVLGAGGAAAGVGGSACDLAS